MPCPVRQGGTLLKHSYCKAGQQVAVGSRGSGGAGGTRTRPLGEGWRDAASQAEAPGPQAIRWQGRILCARPALSPHAAAPPKSQTHACEGVSGITVVTRERLLSPRETGAQKHLLPSGPVASAAPRSPGPTGKTQKTHNRSVTTATRRHALFSLSPLLSCVSAEAGASRWGPDTLLPGKAPRRVPDRDGLRSRVRGALGLRCACRSRGPG